MDLQSPRPTTAIRRNPPRRAKQNPSTNAPDRSKPSSTAAVAATVAGITPFPLDDLLRPDPLQIPPPPEPNAEASESLKVFLRIRPLEIRPRPIRNPARGGARGKGASPKGGKSKSKSKSKACLVVNDSSSVTLSAPIPVLDSKRAKSEVYDGFSFVFPQDSFQKDIYEKVVDPLVMDFLEGKSALLAAMGPTGSGKTHTMFGSPREPGMVPLALQKIFGHASCIGDLHPSRLHYLSMFEIYSERGKGERLFDLLPDHVDLTFQQSSIKGLQEVMVSNDAEAESLIARGMLKRATAVTNANNQSSRSHCIINIRIALESTDDVNVPSNSVVLTIVDLAGAERERKTGNQGARLLESNFINNTSMVFGLCLRSLLEHQKNPKKTFQKHFNNSLLTRYLKDYLEGKKRMTLILTVKPGEEDYLDTSCLLRQASPYMKIKFNSLELCPCVPSRKRSTTSLIKLEKLKRKKYNDSEALLVDGEKDGGDAVIGPQVSEKEIIFEKVEETEPLKNSDASPISLRAVQMGKLCYEDHDVGLRRMARNDEIMRKFSRALWNVLKQYKQKLVESDNEVHSLKETLKKKTTQIMELEEELKELRSSNSCYKQSLEEYSSEVDACALRPPLPSANWNKSKSSDAHIGNSFTPVLVCQNPERSLVKEDLEVENPVIKGILLDTNLTGDNEGIMDSLVKQSTLSVEEKTVENSSVNDFCLSMPSCQIVQIPEKFSGSEHAHDGLEALTESGVLSVSSSLEQKETGHKDSSSSVRSLVLDDEIISCSSVEKFTLLEDKKQPESHVSLIEDVRQNGGTQVENPPTKEKLESSKDKESKPWNAEKPKRRLLPASAMLQKEFSGLDLEVEDPKEIRGKLASRGRGRSEGSIALVRLLKGHLQH